MPIMPRESSKCTVPGCENRVHAKGYCRKHYGQIWRKGKIYAQNRDGGQVEKAAGLKTSNRDDNDRMRALERELRRAEMMYRNVIGFEGRLKWRREIVEVKKEMTRLGMPIPISEPAQNILPTLPSLGLAGNF
ncbi:MAG: hypothetical protein LBE84_01070 [Planctomycetota bacterium]|jgi:hypothetical protein|nr:hypothetical protein [Planctomycetota bacterium]